MPENLNSRLDELDLATLQMRKRVHQLREELEIVEASMKLNAALRKSIKRQIEEGFKWTES